MKHSLIGIIMGSQSDWVVMQAASDILQQFEIAHEVEIISAHRTPDKLTDYAKTAQERGIQVIIAGAGGAAHLPGMTAAHTILPVLGVPAPSQHLNGIDSLLSIIQMPKGIPVGTLAIGQTGAVNAALLAVAVLALYDKKLQDKLVAYRQEQTEKILEHSVLKES